MFKKILIIALITTIIGISGWYVISQKTLVPDSPLKEGWKMYENSEFGFKFQYPEGWTVTEERNTNPHNIFKVGVTPLALQYFQPFYVLVKKKEASDQIVANARALGRVIEDINVGGKSAIRYEYEGEVHYVSIKIPVTEEYSFIIGNERNENPEEYKQILGSFRFLNE